MIKLLNIVKEILLPDVDYYTHRNTRTYEFSTEKFDYQVNIIKNEVDSFYPYLGFKAKKQEEPSFNFDMDIITNDNIYKVTNIIRQIIEHDSQTHQDKGYTISTSLNKKGNQRMNFYRRILTTSFNIEPTDTPNRFIITQSSNIFLKNN